MTERPFSMRLPRAAALSEQAFIPLACLSFLIYSRSLCMDGLNTPKLWLIALAACIGAWSSRSSPSHPGADRLWMIFGVAFCLSSIMGVNLVGSIWGGVYCGWENCILGFMSWVAFESGRGMLSKKPDIALNPNPLPLWAGGCAVVGGLLCIAQSCGVIFSPTVRAAGAMGQPAFTGALLAVGIPYCLALRRWELPFAVVLAGIFCTGARAPLLAAVVAVAWHYRDRLSRRAWILFGVLAAVLLIFFFNQHGISDAMRLDHWRLAAKAWLVHPWLGWGPGTGALWFLKMRDAATVAVMGSGNIQLHAHNLPLNVLATQGLLGLAAWVMLLAGAWRVAGSTTRGALLAAGACSLTNPLPHVVYPFLSLSCGLDLGRAPGATQSLPGSLGRTWALRLAGAVCLLMGSLQLAGDLAGRRGEVARLAGDRRAAVSWYLLAARISPAEPIYPMLAAREAAAGIPDPASDAVGRACLRSLRLHPVHPMVLSASARAMAAAGRRREAQALAQAARRLDPAGALVTPL